MERTSGALCSLLVFTTLPYFNLLHVLSDWGLFGGLAPPKSLIFIGNVIILVGFVFYILDVVYVYSGWYKKTSLGRLGGLWGPLGAILGTILGPLGASQGIS